MMQGIIEEKTWIDPLILRGVDVAKQNHIASVVGDRIAHVPSTIT
jgi:hypothetical protein